jgi:hypothetical protein
MEEDGHVLEKDILKMETFEDKITWDNIPLQALIV